jgi:hypothetical protein
MASMAGPMGDSRHREGPNEPRSAGGFSGRSLQASLTEAWRKHQSRAKPSSRLLPQFSDSMMSLLILWCELLFVSVNTSIHCMTLESCNVLPGHQCTPSPARRPASHEETPDHEVGE